MVQQLGLHQELMLLAIRDDNGTFAGGMYLYAIAGGMISELLLQEKIVASADKHQLVTVKDSASAADPVLNELLEQMSQSRKPRGLQHWVSKAAAIPGLKHRVAGQLCDLGILKPDERKVLWVFTQKVYPEYDGSVEDAIRQRMADVMFDPGTYPDGKTAVLIALASHAGLLNSNFDRQDLRTHRKRIANLAKGEILAAGATQSAIQAMQAAIMMVTIMPAIMVASTSSH